MLSPRTILSKIQSGKHRTLSEEHFFLTFLKTVIIMIRLKTIKFAKPIAAKLKENSNCLKYTIPLQRKLSLLVRSFLG